MLKRIPLARVRRNPDQPRQTFDREKLEELADSIAKNGLMQPITVRPIDEPDHDFEIIAGERRYRAHLILQERGEAETILAHVRRMDDEEMHINAILENLQRAEVSPLEEAVAYQRAIDHYGFTPADLAARLGVSQVWRITDRLQLLGLTADNRDLVAKGVVSLTQAYHMARLSPNGQQAFLQLVKQGLVSTNKAAAEAADAIAAKEAQVVMFADAAPPKRQSIASVEDRIDKLGTALQPLFRDGPFRVDGAIDPGEAARCLEKIRLAKAHLGQIERELQRAASVSAAA